jgi:hypothetical protein
MWVVVYRPTRAGSEREQRSNVFPTREQAKEHATALLQQHDVLRIELAGLQVGQSYERRDGRIAVVAEADPTGQSGRLRFANGDSEWTTLGRHLHPLAALRKLPHMPRDGTTGGLPARRRGSFKATQPADVPDMQGS